MEVPFVFILTIDNPNVKNSAEVLSFKYRKTPLNPSMRAAAACRGTESYHRGI